LANARAKQFTLNAEDVEEDLTMLLRNGAQHAATEKRTRLELTLGEQKLWAESESTEKRAHLKRLL
jgi:hypothetical protein